LHARGSQHSSYPHNATAQRRLRKRAGDPIQKQCLKRQNFKKDLLMHILFQSIKFFRKPSKQQTTYIAKFNLSSKYDQNCKKI
jgi:hypothetical protein